MAGLVQVPGRLMSGGVEGMGGGRRDSRQGYRALNNSEGGGRRQTRKERGTWRFNMKILTFQCDHSLGEARRRGEA